MSKAQVEPMQSLTKRIGITILIFAILSTYLYVIQNAYEHEESSKLLKPFLFSMVILGGSLSWDITKHIFSLPVKNLEKFVSELKKTAFYIVIYVVFFSVSFGVWGGWATIFIVFYVLISFVGLIAGINSFTRAVEAALLVDGTLPTKNESLQQNQ